MTSGSRISVQDIIRRKKEGRKITMLTAYDYPMASIVDKAGIDIILVGDSLANVVLGLESTKEVGMTEMLHHSRAVSRAVENAMVIGDMPFESFQQGPEFALQNARRFIREGVCDAVKVEWFDNCEPFVRLIVAEGIPVMGHIGLTPQTADKLGGYKVQGKDARSAERLFDQAGILQKEGCFGLILECIPDEIARMVTEKTFIPTIGIGAGRFCDGQVLVAHDLLGFFERFKPKFAKRYVHLNPLILQAVSRFKEEVEQGQFPDDLHSFKIKKDELDKLRQE